MGAKTYQVSEVAGLTGLTVRTLHYYDSIGLLVPTARTDAGYRLYTDDDLLRLQQILIGRELGLSLEQITAMLDRPGVDRLALLREHRAQLVRQGDRLSQMLSSVDAAIAALEGDSDMNPKQLFDGFDPAAHEAEAAERWGETSQFKEAGRRTRRYTPEDWTRIKAENDAVMDELAAAFARGVAPADPEAMDLAERHRRHIDRWYYPCPHATHAGLAGLYVGDDRFRTAIEERGEGLAAFLADAIRANTARQQA